MNDELDFLRLLTAVQKQIESLNGEHTRRDIARIARSVAAPFGIDDILVPYLVQAVLATHPPRDQPLEAEYGFDLGGVVFDEPDTIEALWGTGEEVLAAVGEPTVIYSPTGIGKTTIVQRVVLAAIGIGEPSVLGYDVKQIKGCVLYIAADRPRQALRSIRRMVTKDDRPTLDLCLRWERRHRIRITPENPDVLLEAAGTAEASLIIIDSIKDVVAGVSTGEGGSAYNNAVQACVANGVDVIALHHARKATSEGRTILSIDDVYGSTWLTAGAGAGFVIALNGVAGEGIVKLVHLKMPSEQVGPLVIDIDYPKGSLTTIGFRDLLKWILEQGSVTTRDAVQYMTGKDNPTEAEKRQVRRKLNRLSEGGEILKSGVGGQMAVWKAVISTQSST